jgi:HEAT repeat protein
MQRFSAVLLLLGAAALTTSTTQAFPDKFLGKSADQWQRELKSASAATRASAAFALGKIGADAEVALPDLLEALGGDKEAAVRDAAALAIGHIVKRGTAGPEIINALCEKLTVDTDYNVKRSCAVALGLCAPDTMQVRKALEKALGDEAKDGKSKGLKQNVAWAMGEICEKSAEPPVSNLLKALRDTDKLVKRDAAIALGKLHAKDKARAAVADLGACVNHEYLELRKAACFSLVELITPKDTKTVKALVARCVDKKEDIEVRRNAALALSNVGGDEAQVAVPLLHDMLKVHDIDWKRRAALAFRSVGEAGRVAQDDLIAALKQQDEELRYNSTIGLGGVKSFKAVPALVDCIANTKEKEYIRVAAAVALLTIGKCDEANAAVPRLIDILDNPKQPAVVRWRILWSLRVHQEALLTYDKLFPTMTKILSEPNLRTELSSTGHHSGKMLRYDCAFLLSVLKRSDAPADVLPVLNEFLHDDSIRIFLGTEGSVAGAKKEGDKGGKGSVSEREGEDGRIMALKALGQLDPGRVLAQAQIMDQLRKMAADNSPFEEGIREEAKKLLQRLK